MKNRVRQFGLPGFELGDYIMEALDFLRQHEPSEGYFVGFSGGKDSIVTLELCRLSEVKHHAYYSCTRIDPPEMYAFIRQNYPDVKWLFPRASFWSLIAKKMPPMRHQRWCCDALKKEPAKSIPLKYRLMGIRSEESRMRAKRPRVDEYNKKITLLKPIFHWPEWAVWSFIETQKLDYPNIYDEGFARIGCVICPFHFNPSEGSQIRVRASQERYPALWKCFRLACKRWFDSKFSLVGSKYGENFDKWWKNYIGGGVILNEKAGD